MRIELRQLRHLLALDKYRNFARAAEAIGLTQPALTRSIQALESSVGTRLFDRDHTRVEPTMVGAVLIQEAQGVLTRASDMQRVMRRIVDVQAGQLRLGAGPVAADASIGIAVGRMVRLHPDIRIDVEIGDWPELTEKVLSGDLEFAVAESSIASDEPRLVVETLPRHRLIWFCRPGHPLTKRSRVTTDDLRCFPLASPNIPGRMADAVGRLAAEESVIGTSGLTVSDIHSSSLEMIREIVRQSDAFSLALPYKLRAEFAQGVLVELEVDGPPAFTNYGVIRLAHRSLSPAAALFLRLLHEAEREIDSDPESVAGTSGALETQL